MRAWSTSVLGLVLALGCATARVDPDLAARVAPSLVREDATTVAFDAYVVSEIEGPDGPADSLGERPMRFVLSGPGMHERAECEVTARHGSIAVSAQAAVMCNTPETHTIVSGAGSTDLFRLARVSGRSEHQDAQRPPRRDDPAYLASRSLALAVRGSGQVLNLHRGGVNGVPLGPVVAALSLDPPEVWIDPALEPPLRARAALVFAAVLALPR